jgi:hypothetical protein
LYLLVTPSVWSAPRLGFLEVAIAAGYLALLFLVFVRSASSAPLVPVHDPVLAFEQAHVSAHQSAAHSSLRGVVQ